MRTVSQTPPFPRIPPMNQLLEQAAEFLSESSLQSPRSAQREAIRAELDQLRRDVVIQYQAVARPLLPMSHHLKIGHLQHPR